MSGCRLGGSRLHEEKQNSLLEEHITRVWHLTLHEARRAVPLMPGGAAISTKAPRLNPCPWATD